MSALNLTIDPQLIVAQTALFLTGVGVVKKLMLDPYVKLRSVREGLTIGEGESTGKTLEQCRVKEAQIQEKMDGVLSQIKICREKAKKEALAQQQALVKQATAEANETLTRLRGDIAKIVEVERGKIPKLAAELSGKVLDRLTA